MHRAEDMNYVHEQQDYVVNCQKENYHMTTIMVAKSPFEKCRVYLGIAQIAFDPPPSLKRARWGTLFPGRLEQMPFELQFSLHKCPKPSWQGFRPPKNKQMPL